MAEASSTAPDDALKFSSPVTALPGVGKARAKLLARLGITTLGDLLRHLPMRYQREAGETPVAELVYDSIGTVRGTLSACRVVRGRRPRFQATLQDDSGTLSLVWFNAGYLRDKLHPGAAIRVQGKVGQFNDYFQMTNPTWQFLEDDEEPAETDERIRPIYPATENLPSAIIEKLVEEALPPLLPQIEDPLDDAFLRERELPSLASAFRQVHRPTSEEEAASGRQRLAFNELLLLQLGVAMRRHQTRNDVTAPALRFSDAIDRHIRDRFPFELTEAQERVVGEIAADLQRTQPMNRLLQGDVGSGKTVVALYAMLMAVADRKQGALMAPTALLAEQHYLSISSMLEGSNVRIALLTGAVTRQAEQRKELLKQLADGRIDLVIGTHALLTESVQFHDLAVAVIDEQHRFGVMQRAGFRARRNTSGTEAPTATHTLVMTATPIPRSLSMTVFGDLDVSTIDTLPPGRTPIQTRVVGQDKVDDVYRFVADRVAKGGQAYVVVPTIDDTGSEMTQGLKNLRSHVRHLQNKYFPDHRVLRVHGRLKRETRQRVMEQFRAGEGEVLVATTVIEVGVDVPNASVMVVEHAERFGLAQLHQLRGRIGRRAGGPKPVCVFLAEPTTTEAQQRMEVIGGTTNGFRLAEKDLEIRGIGDLFGTRQHGAAMFRVAELPRDMDLLQLARRDARKIIDADPTLKAPDHVLLRQVLMRQYGQTLGLSDVA